MVAAVLHLPIDDRPLARLSLRHDLLAITVRDPREYDVPPIGLVDVVVPHDRLDEAVRAAIDQGLSEHPAPTFDGETAAARVNREGRVAALKQGWRSRSPADRWSYLRRGRNYPRRIHPKHRLASPCRPRSGIPGPWMFPAWHPWSCRRLQL